MNVGQQHEEEITQFEPWFVDELIQVGVPVKVERRFAGNGDLLVRLPTWVLRAWEFHTDYEEQNGLEYAGLPFFEYLRRLMASPGQQSST